MNIGQYTFAEYKELATNFHGYPAPGILVGGYMVEAAKELLPEGTLFEAISESAKCLPDAVQLLSLCSIGNNWLKVQNLGKYAVSLYDKFTGAGYRVSINPEKLKAFPEIEAWFMKKKPKAEQDTDELLRQIEAAGATICDITPIQVKSRFLGHKKSSAIVVCPICKEAYPQTDGNICRACQGLSPYTQEQNENPSFVKNEGVKVVPVEEAVGKKVLHDMTRIDSQNFKGVEFKKGTTITAGDVCRLQQMGRFNVAIEDDENNKDRIHENDAIQALAPYIAGEGIEYDNEPKEGKISFKAAIDGLLTVDSERLTTFNLVPDMMLATRHNGALVKKGRELAGGRIIPLFTGQANIDNALEVLDDGKLLTVQPLRKAKVAILVTGTEVFKGIIEDKFMPIIEAKVKDYNCDIVFQTIVPDSKEEIASAINKMKENKADLLITTGGLSVDPDDITRDALREAGMNKMLYGMPMLPGAMSLVGKIPYEHANTKINMQVIGVPACALYFKTTVFDVLLPRLLANVEIQREDIAKFAHGGFCTQCKSCTYPHCAFAKA